MSNYAQLRFSPNQLVNFRLILDAKKQFLIQLEEKQKEYSISLAKSEIIKKQNLKPKNISDNATIDQFQELAIQLSENETLKLNEVEQALQRLDDGTYGQCLECEEDIHWQRLIAVPETAFCKECKSVLERESLRYKKPHQDEKAPSFAPLIPGYPD
ncbi:MAG: TraR/DksA family transcriptional regulator [Bdellovibrionaceae bacterium]|nr:TraR/DksA family transcriptional regulator [Pseudobdellovibrionaceae bacterium]